MKIIYIADDGTQFDNEFDCEAYEWRLNHPHLKDIILLDKDGNRFEDAFSEEAYNYSEKIIITSYEALKDLQDLEDYTGYCCYADINEVGEWRFDKAKERFVMIK